MPKTGKVELISTVKPIYDNKFTKNLCNKFL